MQVFLLLLSTESSSLFWHSHPPKNLQVIFLVTWSFCALIFYNCLSDFPLYLLLEHKTLLQYILKFTLKQTHNIAQILIPSLKSQSPSCLLQINTIIMSIFITFTVIYIIKFVVYFHECEHLISWSATMSILYFFNLSDRISLSPSTVSICIFHIPSLKKLLVFHFLSYKSNSISKDFVGDRYVHVFFYRVGCQPQCPTPNLEDQKRWFQAVLHNNLCMVDKWSLLRHSYLTQSMCIAIGLLETPPH